MTSDPLPPTSGATPRSSGPAPALFQERQPVASQSPVVAWVLAVALVLAAGAALLVFA